jgi:hypothetical protein
MKILKGTALALITALIAGCTSPEGTSDPAPPTSSEDNFTSDVATLLDFEFDGSLLTDNATNPAGQIRAQLLFTVGHLNRDSSVARLNKLVLSAVTTAPQAGGLTRIGYHAKLPVAWGSKKNLPTSYALSLPLRLDAAGQQSFFTTYSKSCVDDPTDPEVTIANLWFHYRPGIAGCSLAAAAITTSTATVKVSASNTTNKYPEYQRIWEDGTLRVLAVFGKYDDGATSDGDPGIEAYNRFLAAARAALPNVATTPAALPANPGAALPDVTLEGALADGRTVQITALLVDRVSTAPPAFDTRYAELTPGADLVLYNGHAGLGVNVAALTKKGRYMPGKYQLFFLNGCDTFAYQDETLAQARALLNADDASGTKYMEILTNAMPAYFSAMPSASMALIGALMNPAAPQGYGAIFKGVDPSQVVVVTGEEDNVYTPSFNPGSRWAGLAESDTVSYKQALSYKTDTLPAGKYVFELLPEAAAPGGDADLRVRVGSAPTPDKTYRCASYLYNSNERCVVTLATPSRVFFSVTGDKSTQASSFQFHAFQSF